MRNVITGHPGLDPNYTNKNNVQLLTVREHEKVHRL